MSHHTRPFLQDRGVSSRSPNGHRSSARATSAPDSLAVRIIDLVLATRAELFHTPTGDAWITYPVNGYRDVQPVGAEVVAGWMAGLVFAREHRAPSGNAVADAARVLVNLARTAGPERRVHVRIAQHEGAVYVDLANAQREAVTITPGGWTAGSCPPDVAFYRAPGMLPLPTSERDGSFDLLWPLLTVAREGYLLIAAWMVQAIISQGALPILLLVGEPGAAKSTTARIIRGLVDPHEAPLLALPGTERDFVVTASSTYMIALDNVGAMSAETSDMCCRLSTGAGLTLRKLFTDAGVVVFSDLRRPLVLTAITPPTGRTDFLDRALVLTLPAMPDHTRRPETEVMREFEGARPHIVGALFDAIATALRRLPQVRLMELPRLADFARVAVAAAPGLGASEQEMLAILGGVREEAVCMALEGSPVAEAVRAFMADQDEWSGTASALLSALGELVGEDARHGRAWPASPRGMSAALRMVAPALRRVGVEVLVGKREGHQGKRIVVIRRVVSPTPPPESASPSVGAIGDAPQELAPVTLGSSEPPSTDDARRVWVRDMGQALDWPRLPFGPGLAIAEGQESWKTFAAGASQGHMDAAVQALSGLDEQEA